MLVKNETTQILLINVIVWPGVCNELMHPKTDGGVRLFYRASTRQPVHYLYFFLNSNSYHSLALY